MTIWTCSLIYHIIWICSLISTVLAFDFRREQRNDRVPVEKTIFKRVRSGDAQILFEDQIAGPECIVTYGEYLYTGIKNGKIIKFLKSGDSFTTLPDIPGARKPRRFAGLRIYNDTLFALDVNNGLYSINLINGEQREILSSFYSNGTVKYVNLNDFDIDQVTSTAYISGPSQIYTMMDASNIIKSNESSGLFVSKNMITNEEVVLFDDLFLPNGVQMSYEYDSLLINELDKFRVLRYYIRGPNKGKLSVFAYVPGQPDNIRLSSSGGYWVALILSGNNTVYSTVGQCVAIELDKNGNIRKQIAISEGLNCFISEASEHFGSLWIGSDRNSYLLKIDRY